MRTVTPVGSCHLTIAGEPFCEATKTSMNVRAMLKTNAATAPASTSAIAVRPITSTAIDQLTSRQNGLASCIKRLTKNAAPKENASSAGQLEATAVPIGGRVFHRLKNEKSARHGTAQPYAYCGL